MADGIVRPPMLAIAEHSAQIAGRQIFWRSAGDSDVPVLYLHGVPTSSDDWTSFLPLTGGLAPDLPGFGRSGKGADGDYTMEGYDAFVEAFLDHVGAQRVRLVVHDWGTAGLLWAQRFPQRVERLVVINGVPLLPGYGWHWIARVWRTRVLGELAMGATTRLGWKQLSRKFTPAPGPMPNEWIDAAFGHFDQGTQRAILRLYRASPPVRLAAAGERIGLLTCPSLVVWGEHDPFIAPRFADAFAQVLGGATEQLLLPDAGHWPWVERPDLAATVAAFLDAGDAGG